MGTLSSAPGLSGPGLQLQSPLGTVARGYAVLTTEPEPGKRFGTVVKSPDAVAPGTRLQATLAGGTLAVIAEGLGPLQPVEKAPGAEAARALDPF